MYAVTGASGQLGRLAIDALLDRGVPADQIVAIVRTPSKVADLAERGVVVRAGDYDAPTSWPAALAGVDTLLLVSGMDMGRRIGQHTTVIEAAEAAGVRRVVYTSILNAGTSSSVLAPEHLATEQALQASGLAYTILRNGWYYENYLGQAEDYIAQGALLGAAGSATLSPAARADYAVAAAATLVEDGHENTIYELGGDKVTLGDIAAAVSQASGAEVAYRSVSPDEMSEILTAAGVPAGYVDMLVNTDRVIVAGELDTDSRDLARLVGRWLTTLTEAADAALRAPAA